VDSHSSLESVELNNDTRKQFQACFDRPFADVLNDFLQGKEPLKEYLLERRLSANKDWKVAKEHYERISQEINQEGNPKIASTPIDNKLGKNEKLIFLGMYCLSQHETDEAYQYFMRVKIPNASALYQRARCLELARVNLGMDSDDEEGDDDRLKKMGIDLINSAMIAGKSHMGAAHIFSLTHDKHDKAEIQTLVKDYPPAMLISSRNLLATDKEAAITLARQAAAKGEPDALVLLGDICIKDNHLRQAFLYYKLAAEAGSPEAVGKLIDMHRQRKISPGNHKQTIAVIRSHIGWDHSAAKYLTEIGELKQSERFPFSQADIDEYEFVSQWDPSYWGEHHRKKQEGDDGVTLDPPPGPDGGSPTKKIKN